MTVAFQRDAESSLLDLVPDSGAVDCEIRTGPMVRVVDVADALSTVPYPDDVSVELTVAVVDETAPWNDGVFDLSVADGAGDCTRCDDVGGAPDADDDAEADEGGDGTATAAASGDADAAVDVGTLSQLLVGYHTVAEARRLGSLSVSSEAVAADLTGAFPPATVSLQQFF